jgi:hypothetical protein
MKKALKLFVWTLGFIILLDLFISGFSNYDYGLRCTRCLREYHVVENRFCGITYWKMEKLIFPGYNWEEITGTPCQHIYRKGGYGQEKFSLFGAGEHDGMTPEGNLFRPRLQTLQDAFDLYSRFPNKELMRETIADADQCLPADATADFAHDPRNKSGYLVLLAFSLDKAQSEQDWKTALESTRAQLAPDTIKSK